jgi:hypothetical protein
MIKKHSNKKCNVIFDFLFFWFRKQLPENKILINEFFKFEILIKYFWISWYNLFLFSTILFTAFLMNQDLLAGIISTTLIR